MTTEPVEPSSGDTPPPGAAPVPPAVPAAPPVPVVPPQPEAASSAAPFIVEPAEAYSFDELSAGPDRAPRAPRRPRPVLLAVSGLVLGALVGGGIGYAIQAHRPPTPLPPLQVARPSYPAGAVDPTAFAADQPRPLAIDGDLQKLLVTAPDGSIPWGDYPDKPSWLSVGEIAERRGDSTREFKDLNSRGFRRAVEVDWKKDDVKYRVTLVQFTPDRASEAKVRASLYHLQPFADGANGGYKIEDEPRHWAESTEQYYYGHALAQRGTVVMEVEAFGTKPVNPDVVKDIAKQQWERLV
ncbi:hypothetical protein F7Q99_12525 [Streptomyces kaniharaensis]|uniref:Uncharacterized protein n=1 Tax=Streptomyces kaniharaensis TaxID=212423 RepID=A0A6N7KRW0_9ACTN|nr:hypothetical protein [Streptomyces kaniharaensis]MQS13088.1 hypothetical protein [Streptomyces kaniharaensis]